MAGQPQLGSNGYFGIDAKHLVVSDPNGTPAETIIEHGDAFEVSITLDFKGSLCHFILCCCLCWEIHYCFEPVCFDCDEDDKDKRSGKRVISPAYCPDGKNLPYVPDPGIYSFGREATLATVAGDHLEPGTYRVSAIVRLRCRCVKECRFKGVSAFTDGPLIEIL